MSDELRDEYQFDYSKAKPNRFAATLKKGGRLVVVEYYKRPNAMPAGNAMEHIRVDEADVIKEIEGNHFHLISEREHIPDSQYMLIFEKR